MKRERHIVHLLYRFAAGGLENVLVQLVNGLPHEGFRHTIVALTEADEIFARRIERADVDIISLHKAPGQPFRMYPTVYRLLRKLRPDVLHSCNLAALEFMPVAWLAGVPLRIHAEHGWDVSDPDGSNRRYRWLRRFYRYAVHDFVAVSMQLHQYLRDHIGVPPAHLHLIPNGVDTHCFRPQQPGDLPPPGFPFDPLHHHVIGYVGRFEPIKNPGLLVDAFIQLAAAPGHENLRLVMVGEGPLRAPLQAVLHKAGLAARAWLPGGRADIPEILRSLSCFVLPSHAEGTSCTLQEAMASACVIIATDVGGNADLLAHGKYGCLVPSNDVKCLANAIVETRHQAPEIALSAQHAAQTLYAADRALSRYQMLFDPS